MESTDGIQTSFITPCKNEAGSYGNEWVLPLSLEL